VSGRDSDVIASDAQARIFESGYRPYRGTRLGLPHSVWALTRHSMERILGLKRPARYKILPFAAIAVAYLPAIAFVGIVALVPNNRARILPSLVPGPSRYYGFITAAIILFATLAAPEAICPDKRSRFLGLYLSSPLNRSTYLLAKALAVGAVLLLVTLGPPLVLLIGLSLQNDGPRGFAEFMGTLGQIFAAGASLSAMFGAIGLAIPSLTDRRALASAGSLLLILGSTVITNVIVYGLGGPRNVLALSLGRLPFELALRIFTVHGLSTAQGGLGAPNGSPLSTVVVVVASIAITAVAAAVTWWRVVATEVTR
jgi:ABC-2 type transport system permease protein